MKKITSIFVVLTLLATLFTAVPVSAASDNWGNESVATAFAGGTGTTSDPYLISNAAELRYMNDLVNSGATYVDSSNATKNYYAAAYKLTADIDMQNTDWIPLGWYRPTHYDTSSSSAVYTPAFTGSFDGNKHVIKNINMNWDQTHPISSYMGFFGYCNGAIITDLGLDNIKIVFSNYDYKYDETNNKTTRVSNSGTLAAMLRSTNITGCYVTNSVVKNTNSGKNDTSVAGFAGALNYGNRITNCYVYNTEICAGQLAAQAGFFGIAYSNGNTLTNCYAAKITCNQTVNFATTYGFGYSNGQSMTVVDCYSTMQDAQGDHISAYDVARTYTAAHSKGVSGVPVETLIKVMKDTGVYDTDANVNAGYPYLKTAFDGVVATSYEGGSGTADDPYQIATAGQLLLASRKIYEGTHNKAHFILTKDIDYGNQPWEPIGWSSANGDHHFCGTFDGNNHVVKNLTLADGDYHYAGFFGLLTGATVKNLGIDNFQLIRKNTAGNNIRVVGGFVGSARSTNAGIGTTITNCYLKNSSVHQTQNYGNSSNGVYTDTNLAAFIGTVDMRHGSTEIKDCYVENVSVYSSIQGRACGFIAGLTDYTKDIAKPIKLTNCYAANVTNGRNNAITTLVGFGCTGSTSHIFNAEKIVLDNCYSTFSTRKGSDTNASTMPNTTGTYFGTEGVEKATIVAAYANLDGWKIDASLSNGYPSFDWETAAVEPDYVVNSITKAPRIQEYTGSKGSYTGKLTGEQEITVDITRNNGVSGATVYVASYDMDGRLIKAASALVDKDAFTFSADVDCEKANFIKVFLWDADQTPVADGYVSIPGKAATLNETWPYVGGIEGRKTNLITIGDSLTDSVWTGSSYSWPKSGWEKYIMDYVDADEVAHVKHGHGGWTMQDFILGKTSYHYCDWQTIKTEFGMGDYIIIALGTNDEGRIEGYNSGKTDSKYYSADQFKAWYEEIAADVKAKGANLIVLTPPPSHREIADGKFYGTNAWATTKALLKLAQEDPSVTVIDIGEAFANRLNELIDAGTYSVEDLIIQKDASGNVTGPGAVYVDSVHFSEYGADLLASVIAEEIAARGIGLEDYITLK